MTVKIISYPSGEIGLTESELTNYFIDPATGKLTRTGIATGLVLMLLSLYGLYQLIGR